MSFWIENYLCLTRLSCCFYSISGKCSHSIFEWVKKHTGFEVSNPPENVETYTFNGDRNQKVNLSKNLQRWAKEFYKRDYEKFKYKL